ncbi:MAG TPA: ROK family protein [Casimicrobiaceae bacterium]|jgi:polyphosphate glucokinase
MAPRLAENAKQDRKPGKRGVHRRLAPRARAGAPYTLAIDIGGTHVKAAVLDSAGRAVVERIDTPTPHPAPPTALFDIVLAMAGALPAFDRISAGFPGVIKDGCVLTAPNLGTGDWRGFPLADQLGKQLGKPARVLNDAEVQGLAVIASSGLECMLTFGTGMGSAIYRDGLLMPHLELGQHPAWKSKTYDQYVGAAALKKIGLSKWNRRVDRALLLVRTLLNFDHLFLGGGNAVNLTLDLPPDMTIVSNRAGITGGVRLWDARFDPFFAKG